jgi:hypothetical protein
MAYFNDPNVTDMIGVMDYTNEVTDGLSAIFLLFVVFLGGALTVPGDYPTKFAGASFLTSISAMLFFTMGLVTENVMVTCVLATAISLIFLLSLR